MLGRVLLAHMGCRCYRRPKRVHRSRDAEGTWMAGKRAGGRVAAMQPVMERLDLLKPHAIGIAQATVIGMATSAPAATGAASASTPASVAIGGAVILVMLVLALVGIRITARAQIAMAVIEYLILIGIAIAGLVWVLGHHAGTYPLTSSWLTLSGVGG